MFSSRILPPPKLVYVRYPTQWYSSRQTSVRSRTFMELRINRPLRDLGIYVFRDETLILVWQSDEISFLFSNHNWAFYGPVNYRVSHRGIYCHGQRTVWTDEDLSD